MRNWLQKEWTYVAFGAGIFLGSLVTALDLGYWDWALAILGGVAFGALSMIVEDDDD